MTIEINITCDKCGYDEDHPSPEDAKRAGWERWKVNDESLIDPEPRLRHLCMECAEEDEGGAAP